MSGQVNIKNLTGHQGGVVLSGAQTETGEFQAFQAIEDTTIVAIATNLDQSTSSLATQTIPSGITIFGDMTSIEISSGLAIAYNK